VAITTAVSFFIHRAVAERMALSASSRRAGWPCREQQNAVHVTSLGWLPMVWFRCGGER